MRCHRKTFCSASAATNIEELLPCAALIHREKSWALCGIWKPKLPACSCRLSRLRSAPGIHYALYIRAGRSHRTLFCSLKEECVWQHNCASVRTKPAPPLLTRSNGTTPNDRTRPSAIAACGSFARGNPNWLTVERRWESQYHHIRRSGSYR
jgi:hypothetical protein